MAIQYETKKEVVEHRVVQGFKCNRCRHVYDANDIFEMQEMLHLDFVGGFGSVWGDERRVGITLCQHCAMVLLGPFVDPEDETAEAPAEHDDSAV